MLLFFSQVCSRFLGAFCVSLCLEKREPRLFEFITSFQQLGLPDEKSVLLDAFLSELHQDMDHDITWQGNNNTFKLSLCPSKFQYHN